MIKITTANDIPRITQSLSISPVSFVRAKIPFLDLRDIPPVINAAGFHELVRIVAGIIQAKHIVEINRNAVHGIPRSGGGIYFVEFAIVIPALFEGVF